MIHFENVSRLEIIQYYIKQTNCVNYLEIGCDRNQVFSKISVPTKIGVDPNRGGTHRMTSDDFFENHNDKKYDVIFIDGLHYYEQVSKDVINSLEVLNPNGIILIHDMLPITPEEAVVPIPANPGIWLGDVWKLGFDLSKNEVLDFKIFQTDHGVGLLQPKNSFDYNTIDFKSNDLDWNYYVDNLSKLPIVSTSMLNLND